MRAKKVQLGKIYRVKEKYDYNLHPVMNAGMFRTKYIIPTSVENTGQHKYYIYYYVEMDQHGHVIREDDLIRCYELVTEYE